MPQEFTIRQASLEDLNAIVLLCSELGYPAQAVEVLPRLERILDDPHQTVFLAESAAGVIGWVHVLPVVYLESDPFAEIGGLVVSQAHRRLGAGRGLMQAAEEWTRQQGLRSVRLRSNTIRTEAHTFYQSLGYKNIKSQYTFVKDL